MSFELHLRLRMLIPRNASSESIWFSSHRKLTNGSAAHRVEALDVATLQFQLFHRRSLERIEIAKACGQWRLV